MRGAIHTANKQFIFILQETDRLLQLNCADFFSLLIFSQNLLIIELLLQYACSLHTAHSLEAIIDFITIMLITETTGALSLIVGKC